MNKTIVNALFISLTAALALYGCGSNKNVKINPDADEEKLEETAAELESGETDVSELEAEEFDVAETETAEETVAELESGETDLLELEAEEFDVAETDTAEETVAELESGETDASELQTEELEEGETTDDDQTEIEPEAEADTVPACVTDLNCGVKDYCNPCAHASCETCADCVAECVPHNCQTEPEPACNAMRPQCPSGQTAVVRGLCWVCVELATCEKPRDKSCDDGSTPTCDQMPPVCNESEILAYVNDCYLCVNPATCKPWGEPGCATDADCAPGDDCSACGTSSCPDCDDCVAACKAHGCPSDGYETLQCQMGRPDCGEGLFSVIKDGCWVCVAPDSCSVAHDPRCDDGTTPTCDKMPPICSEIEILAYVNNCYICVNPSTCKPWGEPGCKADADCAPYKRCDSCGASSCPICLDCVPACVAHGCATEEKPACNQIRPQCEEGQTAIVKDGCWLCVELAGCQKIRDTRCDDGTTPICLRPTPVCEPYEILAYRNNCYECVYPSTCKSWTESSCQPLTNKADTLGVILQSHCGGTAAVDLVVKAPNGFQCSQNVMNSSHSCNYGRYGVAHIESYAQTCKQGQCEHITVSGAQDGNYVLCAELTYSCDFFKSTANVNATCGQLTEIGFILNTYDASQATFAGWTQTVYGTLSDASYSVCYGVKKSHGAWGELELITK